MDIPQKLSGHDAAEMWALLQEGFPGSSWSLEKLHSFLALDTCRAWGIRREGALVSFAIFQVVLDEAELILIVTHPAQQRKGMTRSFLELIEGLLKEVRTLFLEVSVENKEALYFYQRVGFQVMGQRKGYYAQKKYGDAYTLSKVIKSGKKSQPSKD